MLGVFWHQLMPHRIVIVTVLFLLNLVRGLRIGYTSGANPPVSEETRASLGGPRRGEQRREGWRNRRSHSFWSRGGSVYNGRSLSSRLLLPEQILAELLRHHRLQPAPLTGPLPSQPLTANPGGPQKSRGGRAILPTAGHVPKQRDATTQALPRR